MKRGLWVGAGLVAYAAAAWTVRPGFYDGFSAPSPYCFVSPPPSAPNCGDHPRAGQISLAVTNGVVDPGSGFAADQQAEISVRPGAFTVSAGQSSVTITITPVRQFPPPTGFKFLTNVYLITANAALDSEGALVTLRYSPDFPAPSSLYQADQGSTTWANLGSTQSAVPYFISANTRRLGYFAAGYSGNASPPPNSPRVGGGQSLPLLIALGIVIVVVAVLPLFFMRRRGADDES